MVSGTSLTRLVKRSRQPSFQLNGRCPNGHTMAEHLNIVTVLEKAISPAERLGMVFGLAKSYAPFFDNLHEICRNNYKTGVAQCEPWPEGESLLAAGAGIEGDIDREVDDGLPKDLADDWTCVRIVVPTHLISGPLKCFATLGESDHVILLKRTSMR